MESLNSSASASDAPETSEEPVHVLRPEEGGKHMNGRRSFHSQSADANSMRLDLLDTLWGPVPILSPGEGRKKSNDGHSSNTISTSDSLDTSQEPVPVLRPEEGGKVQQEVAPGRSPQQVQHPISHLQSVMVLAVLLQALHDLLVGGSRQSLL